jgi:hypothetical protein
MLLGKGVLLMLLKGSENCSSYGQSSGVGLFYLFRKQNYYGGVYLDREVKNSFVL